MILIIDTMQKEKGQSLFGGTIKHNDSWADLIENEHVKKMVTLHIAEAVLYLSYTAKWWRNVQGRCV